MVHAWLRHILTIHRNSEIHRRRMTKVHVAGLGIQASAMRWILTGDFGGHAVTRPYVQGHTKLDKKYEHLILHTPKRASIKQLARPTRPIVNVQRRSPTKPASIRRRVMLPLMIAAAGSVAASYRRPQFTTQPVVDIRPTHWGFPNVIPRHPGPGASLKLLRGKRTNVSDPWRGSRALTTWNGYDFK